MSLSNVLSRSLQASGLLLATFAATCTQAIAAPKALAEPTARASGAAPPAAPSKPRAAALQHLIRDAQLRCTDTVHGEECIAGNLESGDFYDVTPMPDCGAHGLFAGVSTPEGAAVLSAIPATGSHARTRTTLAQDRRLCIQAVARAAQQPRYYYVVEVALDIDARCRDSAACDRPMKRRVASLTSNANGRGAVASHQHAGESVQGWVEASAIEVFEDGT